MGVLVLVRFMLNFLQIGSRLFGFKTLKIQSQLSIESILKLYFIKIAIVLMKLILTFSNRPKFSADSLKLLQKCRKYSKNFSNSKSKNENKSPRATKGSVYTRVPNNLPPAYPFSKNFPT